MCSPSYTKATSVLLLNCFLFEAHTTPRFILLDTSPELNSVPYQSIPNLFPPWSEKVDLNLFKCNEVCFIV